MMFIFPYMFNKYNEYKKLNGALEMLMLPSKTIKILIPSLGDFVTLQE